jgi:hypothetical protein
VAYDRGDRPCGGAFRCVDHDQEFHQRRVHGLANGLHEEHIGAADALQVADVDLAVGESGDLDRAELDAEMVHNASRELKVPAAREDHHPAFVTCHRPARPFSRPSDRSQ